MARKRRCHVAAQPHEHEGARSGVTKRNRRAEAALAHILGGTEAAYQRSDLI